MGAWSCGDIENKEPLDWSGEDGTWGLVPNGIFAGVLNAIGRGTATAALLLRRGSFWAESSARFNLCAERPALSAAAVVTATAGVTL